MMELLTEIWDKLSILEIACIFGTPVWLSLCIYELFKLRVVRKNTAKRLEELETQKCDGPHKWIFMPVDGETVNVCQRCYWSPVHEGYIKKFFVDAEIRQKQFKDELEKHVEEKLKELNISKELYEKVINIKKDFALDYMEKTLKEMCGE